MILCLIILIIGVITLAVGIVSTCIVRKSHCYSSWDYVSPICVILGIVFTLIATTLLIVVPMDNNKKLSNFLNQKEYIESYEPTSEYDNAAITSKKIELNEWLYTVQYNKEHYPICSFYGDEILDIEPIK